MATGKIKTLFSDKEKTEALFPRTKVNAVSDADGTGLDAILDDLSSEISTKATEAFVTNKIAEAQLSGGSGGNIDLSGYATKDDVKNIDFPVDSVNGKTGAVTLSAEDVGAVPTSTGVQVYSRSDIGTSPNFNNPNVNGLFEIRASAEISGESGDRPFASNRYGAFLNLKTPDNIAMMQIAGDSSNNQYIRSTQKGNVSMDGIPWQTILTNENISQFAPPPGYGLGTPGGKTVTTDCNDITSNGWYYVSGAANAAHPYDHAMLVVGYGPTALTQIAFLGNAYSSMTYILIRKRYGANWNEWEWLNPGMEVGVEYRTTERWNGVPVYTKLVDLGTTTADMTVWVDVPGITRLIRAVPNHNNTRCGDWNINVGVHANNTLYFAFGMGENQDVGFYARCGEWGIGKNLKAQIWYTKN